MKDIKTKEKNHTIKTNKKNDNFKHFIKKNSIEFKRHKKEENNAEVQDNNYAINKVVDREKKTAYQSFRYNKQLFMKRKNKKQNEDQNNEFKKAKRKNNPKNLFVNKKMEKPADQKVIKIKDDNTKISNENISNHYNQQVKSFFIAKQKSKIRKTKDSLSTIEKSSHHSAKFFKGTVSAIKKTVTGVNNLISFGTGLILLIVIVLFIGVFSALSDDSSVENGTMYVSAEVLGYTEIIEMYAEKYEVFEYVPLIQAVMMQESGGKGLDPMQSSECPYNEKYAKQPDGIQDVEYSIDCGVHYLSDCLKAASVKSISDMKNISLALQGYNYGNGYIDWALEHFEGYTRANAKLFSDEMKAKLKVDVYGDPNYVEHVLRYYHIANGDIVAVAKSQVGNVGGKKYWKWYGFDSHVEWCAIFVSWCANESGDLNVSIPKFSRVEDGIQWFKDNKKWADKNYKPKSGDLIFFDWNNDNDPDHVGIVESSDNQYVYTIEGNSNDECREKKYSLINEVVRGYGMK